MPEQAGFTEYKAGQSGSMQRFGLPNAMIATPLTPWRLQPSLAVGVGAAPESQTIVLGSPWPKVVSDAARGIALHLALRTYLQRPDLTSELPAATGLDETALRLVAERASALKSWLVAQGYTELRCEIPVLGHTPEGAEIPGTIDLLAVGPNGCLLIDHKSGGAGQGLGPYWPQLSAYAGLLSQLLPDYNLRGIAVFWLDHGALDVVMGQHDIGKKDSASAQI